MASDIPNTERPSLSPSFTELAMPSFGVCDFNDPKEIMEHFGEYRCLLAPIFERSDSDEEAARIMRDEIGLKEKMTLREGGDKLEKLQFVSAINSRSQIKDVNHVVDGFRHAM